MKSYSIAMVAACPFPANYGSPASIREMSETLSQFGHRIHIMTYPHGQGLPVGQARIHRIPNWGWSKKVTVGPTIQKPFLDFLLVIWLYRLIRKEKIQLIHTHNYEGTLVGLVVKWMTGTPVLYNAVNTMSDELPGYRFIRPAFVARWLAKFLDWFIPIFPNHITVVSEELEQAMIDRGVPRQKVSLVPAGIHPKMFTQSISENMRDRFSVGTSPIVMYTGTLDPFQRIDYLIRAFLIVAKEEPTARLMIVNNIEQTQSLMELQAVAERLGLKDKVIWAGPHSLEDLPAYLAMATVTVVPRPDCPGHPVKLLNYMAAAKPIISFEGSAKGLRHKYNALVVPDHDYEKMGSAILEALRNPPLAKSLGQNARKTVEREFDWEILSRKIEILYEGIIENNGHVDRKRFDDLLANLD